MNINEAFKIINNSKNITFVTGAGISKSSGIPTFHNKDDISIWDTFKKFSTWDLIEYSIFNNPTKCKDFFLSFIEPIASAKPTKAHNIISKLQNFKNVNIITQNIDGLHNLNNDISVVEIHGTIFNIIYLYNDNPTYNITQNDLKRICNKLEKFNVINTKLLLQIIKPILECKDNIIIKRPDIIMFGDIIDEYKYRQIQRYLINTDCIIKIGLLTDSYYNGNSYTPTISINPNKNHNNNIKLSADEALNQIYDKMLSNI